MRLIHIKAQNFMRFRKLELLNLPEKGLFVVQGPNESGKSTMGHLLYFAFSGKPFLAHLNLENLIHWEGATLKIEILFEEDGEIYSLCRQMDRDLANYSSLSKGAEAVAQGNIEVKAYLVDLLGYDPEQMNSVFIAQHHVLKRQLEHDPKSSLLLRLGLDEIKLLIKEAGKDKDICVVEADKFKAEKTQLEREIETLGHKPEELQKLQQSQESLSQDVNRANQQLEHSRLRAKQLKEQLQCLEEEQRFVEKLYKDEGADLLETEIHPNLARLESLKLDEKNQEILNSGLEVLRHIEHFQKSSLELEENYEKRLNHFRSLLGLSEELSDEESSFPDREKELSEAMTKAKLKSISWAWLFSLIFAFSAGLVLMFIKQMALREWANGVSWILELSQQQKVAELIAWFNSHLGANEQGWPQSPLVYGVALGLFAFSALFFMILVMSFSKKRGLAQKGAQLSKEKEQAEEEYHRLLSADFKDLKEVGEVLNQCSQDKLKEAYEKFLESNLFAESCDYSLRSLFGSARAHLEEATQSLSLLTHRASKDLQQCEEKQAALQNDLAKLQPLITAQLTQEEKTRGLKAKRHELNAKENVLRAEMSVNQFLSEMAEGCLLATTNRLRHSLTAIYKKLMPQLTTERYGSIRLDENFRMQVFSDDRGDFVPLEQLSSGTYDLFLLVFYLLQVHGFMEAHSLNSHFLFLDEALPGVDDGRYELFTQTLPQFSSSLKQMFLCRPMGRLPGHGIALATSLETEELIRDFKSL